MDRRIRLAPRPGFGLADRPAAAGLGTAHRRHRRYHRTPHTESTDERGQYAQEDQIWVLRLNHSQHSAQRVNGWARTAAHLPTAIVHISEPPSEPTSQTPSPSAVLDLLGSQSNMPDETAIALRHAGTDQEDPLDSDLRLPKNQQDRQRQLLAPSVRRLMLARKLKRL